jgi:hypothetical protein
MLKIIGAILFAVLLIPIVALLVPTIACLFLLVISVWILEATGIREPDYLTITEENYNINSEEMREFLDEYKRVKSQRW